MGKHPKKLGYKPCPRAALMVNKALGREGCKVEQFERRDTKFVTTPKKKKMVPLYTLPITPPKKKITKCEEAFDKLLKDEQIKTYGRTDHRDQVKRSLCEDNEFGSVFKKRKKLFQDDDDDDDLAGCYRTPGRPFTSLADLWNKSPETPSPPLYEATSPVRRSILSPVSHVQRPILSPESPVRRSILSPVSQVQRPILSPVSQVQRPILSPVSHVQRSILSPLSHAQSAIFNWTTGFPNTGNTCFMNSVIQCILRIPKVQEIVKDDTLKGNSLPKESVIRKLLGILKGDGNLASNLKEIANVCSVGSATKFNIGAQQDAHEFMLKMLDRMELELTKYGNPDLTAKLKNLFRFETRKRSICNKCSKETICQETEAFTIMTIPIPSDSQNDLTLQTLISKFLEDDTDNCITCGCNTMKRYKRMENLPEVLIIQLVRYTYINERESAKVKTHVCPNSYLNLDEYLTTLRINTTHNNNNNALRSPLKGIENNKNQLITFAKSPLKSNPNQSNIMRPKVSMKGGYGLKPGDNSEEKSKNVLQCIADVSNNIPLTELPDLTDNVSIDILTDEERLNLAIQASLDIQDIQETKDLNEAINLSRSDAGDIENTEVLPIFVEENEVPGQYQLTGIISHKGSEVNQGHYISYVFDKSTEIWHKYNDDLHNVITRNLVKSETLRDGYLFFYCKR